MAEMIKIGVNRKAGGRNNPKNYRPPKQEENKEKGFRKGMKDKLKQSLKELGEK